MAPYLCKAQGGRVRLDKCNLVRCFASPIRTGGRNCLGSLTRTEGAQKHVPVCDGSLLLSLAMRTCHLLPRNIESLSFMQDLPSHAFPIPVLVRQWTRECENSRCRREGAGRKRARVVSHCLCFCSRLIFQAASAPVTCFRAQNTRGA